MLHYLSNENNHFFVVEGVDLDKSSSDLKNVIFYNGQQEMHEALAKEEGVSVKEAIGKEFLLTKRDEAFILRFLGTEKKVEILECQFYRDGVLETCFSVEDFLSLYSL